MTFPSWPLLLFGASILTRPILAPGVPPFEPPFDHILEHFEGLGTFTEILTHGSSSGSAPSSSARDIVGAGTLDRSLPLPQHLQGIEVQEQGHEHGPRQILEIKSHAGQIWPQQWEHYPWDGPAEPQGLTHDDLPLPLDHVAELPRLHDPEDRDPDDLSAVVFGQTRASNHFGTNTDGNDAMPEALSASVHHNYPQTRRWPDVRQQQRSPLTTLTTLPSQAYLVVDEPLSLSGKPVVLLYQENDSASSFVTQIRKDLGFKRHRDVVPRKRRSEDDQSFVESMSHLFNTERLFKEFVHSQRRYLITYLNHVETVSDTLSSFGILVWELETDGTRAVMLCRGVYQFNRKVWSTLESSSPLATGRLYVLSIRRRSATDSGILQVRQSEPGAFVPYFGPTRSRLIDRHGLPLEFRIVRAVGFLYQPDPHLLTAFTSWTRRSLMSRLPNYEPKAPIELPVEEMEAFSTTMYTSFRRRLTLRPVQLNGQTCLLTNHPPSSTVSSLHFSSFTAVWRQEGGTGETAPYLVAVALYPMTRHTFNLVVEQAKLPTWRFSLSG